MALQILAFVGVWLVCSLVNLVWYRFYGYIMASEFRPALILIAPLATAIVVIGMLGFWFYSLVLWVAGIRKKDF